jgi:hypothetical protein
VATLWLGGAAPHKDAACGSCHDETGHTFQPRCVGCHSTLPAPDATLASRASALWARLGGTHHSAGVPRPAGEAARKVSLVVEDRGAWAHNPAYARQLLEEAERAAR